MTDIKTLRLASLQLSEERLENFMIYQRTLLRELAVSSNADWSGRYAFAHSRALAASKLDLVDLGKLKAMVGEYCGRRSASLLIKDRVSQAKASDTPQAAQIIARAAKQLPRLDDLSQFTARHGVEAVALLEARESELLELHRDLAKREGTGHLHFEQ